MNKRLEILEKMTRSGQADSFAWYGLAMEYRKAQRSDEALATFETLRSRDADYVPMYLMAGQMLIALGRADEAALWLQQGIAKARAAGDTKALGELESALSDAGEAG